MEDPVKEAFTPQLDDIIWFYYSHCPLKETIDYSQTDTARPQTPQRPQTPIQQNYSQQQTPSQPSTPTNNIPYLSPSAFTPLLHTLLLDQNTGIAQAAQFAIQSLVERILEEPGVNPKERELLEKETLEGVVLGVGRLDQEKPRKEETNEWEPYGDEHGVGVASGGEEEAELGRMTMMSLISSLASIIGPERCIRLFLPELEKMVDEPVFYVRKEAALALGSLSSVLPLDIIISKLLPIYDHFSNDAIWHVRRSCCLVLPTICSRLPDEMKSERAVKGIELFAGDVSRSVRSAAGEIIGELIAIFYPNGNVPESLVQHFLSLGPLREANVNINNNINNNDNNDNMPGGIYSGLGQRDPERPVICAFNFPAVVLTLGESRWDDLKETYISLTRDMQVKVRRSLSYSLHEIAKVIGPKKTEEDLLPTFICYLVDLEEVKSGIMENFSFFISCLPQTARNNCLPSLCDTWDGLKLQWRLRNTIAKQLPALCHLYDGGNVMNYLLPLAIKAVKDEVATVRETVVTCFPALIESVRSDDRLFNELINRICEFASENKFRSRVIFVQICQALALSEFPKIDFEKYFLPVLEKFSTDNVVDVRISVVKLIKILCQAEQYYQDPTSRPPQIINMIKKLEEDPDFDVRSFLFMVLSPEDEERLRYITTIQRQSATNITIENSSKSITENEENSLDSQEVITITSEKVSSKENSVDSQEITNLASEEAANEENNVSSQEIIATASKKAENEEKNIEAVTFTPMISEESANEENNIDSQKNAAFTPVISKENLNAIDITNDNDGDDKNDNSDNSDNSNTDKKDIDINVDVDNDNGSRININNNNNNDNNGDDKNNVNCDINSLTIGENDGSEPVNTITGDVPMSHIKANNVVDVDDNNNI